MAEEKKLSKQPKFKFKEIVSTVKKRRILATYSIGTLGGGGFSNFTKSMRNIYFVQIMGLSNAQYASATVIGNVVNGISNPVIGFLMDKRIFKRKYTPWILIGAFGMTLSYIVLYAIPWTPIVNNSGVAWFSAMLMVVLVGLFHAVGKINGSCIFAALTMDGRERILAKMLSGWIGGLGKTTGRAIWPLLFTFFTNRMSEEKSYLPTVFILALILIVFALIKWREIRKFIPGDIEGVRICEETGKIIVEDRIPAKDMIKNLLKNYPLFIIVIVGILNMTKRTFNSANRAMYYRYIIGDMRWMTVGSAFGAMFSPILKISVPIISLMIGDPKALVVISKYGNAVTRVLLFFFGRNIWFYFVIGLVGGGFNRMGTLGNGILTAGAIDYGEWKNGVRHSGLIVAFKGVGANIGQAAGIILRSWFFEKIGFVPGFTADEAFKKRFMNIYLASAAFSFVNATLLLLFYPINKKKLEEIRQLVETRRAEKALEEAQRRRAERAKRKEQ